MFADKYIAVHLKALAPGQTYPQLSAQSLTNLPNPKLVQETQTLFRGETLRAGCSRPGAYASRTFWALTAAGQLMTYRPRSPSRALFADRP